MLNVYSLENKLERQQQKTFALTLSKWVRIRGEFVHGGRKKKIPRKNTETTWETLLLDMVKPKQCPVVLEFHFALF